MPVWKSTYDAKVAELKAALDEIRKQKHVILNLEERRKADMKALKAKHKKMEVLGSKSTELEKSLLGMKELTQRKMEALKEIHDKKIASFSENEKKLCSANASLKTKLGEYAKLQNKVLELKGKLSPLLSVERELAKTNNTLGKMNEELNTSKRESKIAKDKVVSLTAELLEERKRVEELRQQLVDVKADLKQTKSWFDAHVVQSGVNFARSVHNVLEQANSGKKRRIGEMRNMMQQVLMNQRSTEQTNAETTD